MMMIPFLLFPPSVVRGDTSLTHAISKTCQWDDTIASAMGQHVSAKKAWREGASKERCTPSCNLHIKKGALVREGC
ncbi:MAG: hypothetical protein EBY62_01565 [Cellvibrionales bacterium]|nr:hypothetical protein [Cellvibrionales bacterium]